MAIRFTRGWLALLLMRSAFLFKRRYVGRHHISEFREGVSQTYHPDHSGVFSILDSPHRHAELWLARFDGRDESEYLSAALMRAPIVKHREYTDVKRTEYVVRWDFSALWTVADFLKAARMADWGWLKYGTSDWPKIWSREMEILNGPALASV